MGLLINVFNSLFFPLKWLPAFAKKIKNKINNGSLAVNVSEFRGERAIKWEEEATYRQSRNRIQRDFENVGMNLMQKLRVFIDNLYKALFPHRGSNNYLN